jgi:PelA/Pel-15E family pectate lyase
MTRPRFATALFIVSWLFTSVIAVPPAFSADDPPEVAEALAAMRSATTFFTRQVATEGGYLYAYSADLKRREGELPATDTMVWVQPPGTPAVGMAYLRAYEATGDDFYRQAARQTAEALIKGQLRSGGWDYKIEFDPQLRKKIAYRVAPAGAEGANVTTLDDDTTQAAIRLLMRMDQALGFKDDTVHEAAQYALTSLVAAQYPNGAWPQRYSQPPVASEFPVLKARYPDQWSRTWTRDKYSSYYTFNDNAIGDVVAVVLEAARVYDDSQYRRAAERAGDFILLAQMPDPQPAWAQQYNARMEPAWARKFEPPAITGGESQSVLIMLLLLARETGQSKYLEPVPRALAYLNASRLPDGRLARFYELRTNTPLYFTRDYQLTESDSDAPTHYTFKMSGRLDNIQKEYDRLQKKGLKPAQRAKPPQLGSDLTARAKRTITSLDDHGRWLETDRLKLDPPDSTPGPIIRSSTFIANLRTLADFVEASRAAAKHRDERR